MGASTRTDVTTTNFSYVFVLISISALERGYFCSLVNVLQQFDRQGQGQASGRFS